MLFCQNLVFALIYLIFVDLESYYVMYLKFGMFWYAWSQMVLNVVSYNLVEKEEDKVPPQTMLSVALAAPPQAPICSPRYRQGKSP